MMINNWATKVLRICFAVSTIFLFLTLGDASVTWRRVSKTTTAPEESVSAAPQLSVLRSLAPKSSTKSPITWKRSTIVRRSTDAVENEPNGDESDELSEAGSEKENLKEPEDSEVHRLVPGSRPGFWFDSSRRKKPASLLRPGTRRNSLFPTRPSTAAVPSTVSTTPAAIIPRTPSEKLTSNSRSSSTRLFGRNRSTAAPVVFKRRLKTSRTPKVSSTTESADLNANKNDDLSLESPDDAKNEREAEDLPKDLNDNETELDDNKPKRPSFNLRRRPYNGTRLSWIKKNMRTTAAPQQLTTTSASPAAQDNDKLTRKTTKFPRTRTKGKINSTAEISRLNSVRTTPKPENSSSASSKLPTLLPSQSGASQNLKSDRNTVSDVHADEDSSEEIVQSAEFGSRHNSSERPKFRVRTTIEPFYITREYGRIATAIAEVSKTTEAHDTFSSEAPESLKDNATPEQVKSDAFDATKAPAVRKGKKRIRTKVTKAPQTTTTVQEKSQNIEKEYDDDSEDIDLSIEYVDDFQSKYTTTEIPLVTTTTEKIPAARVESHRTTTTTTIRPVTLPILPTFDPSNNNNAYVVWSVGHGGSGWSYQKHGGNVKWSAQNSEAEGDSWSVEGKVEADKDSDLYSQWIPIRNPATGNEKNEGLSTDAQEKLALKTKKKADSWINTSSVIYTPPSRNKSASNFQSGLEYFHPQNEIINNSSAQYGYPTETSSPNFTPDLNSLPITVFQEPETSGFVPEFSSTSPPTIEDQFNAQVEGILNQHPVVPDFPYIAEIRETYRNRPTDTPTTEIFKSEEYKTHNIDAGKDLVTPSEVLREPFVPEYQTNSLPADYPQVETISPYTADLSKDSNKDIAVVNQIPSVNAPYQSYSSNIPPELAKAVVESKNWRIAGNGGHDGWSLLNEDGVLEWKIHNVDGQWKVTSADELLKTQVPLQLDPYAVDEQESENENYGYINSYKENSPKIWTLDDDYAKWRAVSAERGIPDVDSLKETSSSSEEYEYDDDEYTSDYYSDESDYNSEPVSADGPSYQPDDDHLNRPIWGNGKNKMIQTHSKNSDFAGNFEIANTREDAIAAWKSLIAQQGHWKLSDRVDGKKSKQLSESGDGFQDRFRTSDGNGPTVRRKFENEYKTQNGLQEPTGQNSKTHAGYLQKGSYPSEEQLLNERRIQINYNTQGRLRENSGFLDKRTNNYHERLNEPKELFSKPNKVLYERNYGSLSESTGQNYGHYEDRDSKRHLPEEKEMNRGTEHKNNYPELSDKIPEHFSQSKIQKYVQPFTQNNEHYDISNHPKASNFHHVNHDNEQMNREKEPETHYYSRESPSNRQNYDTVSRQDSDISSGSIPDSRIHIKNKDHSKLDSLINKLEAIQREAKGRAVIDLTALLKQMKARRNNTYSTTSGDNLDVEHQHSKTTHYQDTEKIKSVDKENLAVQENSDHLPETQRQFQNHSEKTVANYVKDGISSYSNVTRNDDLHQNIRHRPRHSRPSNKVNRRKRPARVQSSRVIRPPDMQTDAENGRIRPDMNSPQNNSHKKYNVTQGLYKNLRDFQNRFSSNHSNSDAFEPTTGSERRDSSSSEETIVDLTDDKSVVPRRQKRPSRKKSRRPHHPPPIVMKGETVIEDEEGGSKKSRKIIVIDYAGAPKTRSSVDKKDLELIIRNVRQMRSEI